MQVMETIKFLRKGTDDSHIELEGNEREKLSSTRQTNLIYNNLICDTLGHNKVDSCLRYQRKYVQNHPLINV